MKKLIYLIAVFLFIFINNAISQKQILELKFTAFYYGQHIPLDSIYIQNLTQGGDTNLYAPDTLLILDYVTGITPNSLSNNRFRVSQNHPNPFMYQTLFTIYLTEADDLQVIVRNLLGQNVAFFENSMEAGNHSFVFYPGDDKYYILTATANGLTKTIKMVSLNNQSSKKVMLNYQGLNKIVQEYKTTQDTNDFGFSLGDQLRFTGFAKNPSDIAGSDVIEATPAGNEEYVFEIVEGIPCPGTPTITFEGQTYCTVEIGDQCWLKENLNIGEMIDGSQNQTNNQIIEKFCFDNNDTNCNLFGGLYQWDEVMQYLAEPGVQGICPPGWHIPTDGDWCLLTQFTDSTVDCSANGFSGTDVGIKMKSKSGWDSGGNGSNSTGFNAIPGGLLGNTTGFYGLGLYCYFWTSSEELSAYAWARSFNYADNGVNRDYNIKTPGFSLRCVKDANNITIPAISTTSISNIMWTTGIGGGEISDDGGAEIEERGVCWSTTQNPTISDNHTNDGTGTGIFISTITGLTPNTNYFVRAFATNSVGTAYGLQVEFTTLNVGEPCPELPSVTYEGQTYNTVKINDQCWLKENLNVGNLIQGSDNQTNNNIIEKYCYNNDLEKCLTYGGLYQWDEMMLYSTQQGTQGICPVGWHLPSKEELTILTNFLGGENIAGGKMKEPGTLHWSPPNTGADNLSGFTAIPGGYRNINGSYSELTYTYNLWSSTENDNIFKWMSVLLYNFEGIGHLDVPKSDGYSVRCVLGESISSIPTVTTSVISDTTQNSATSGGEVIHDGGSFVSARGVCWSIFQNPTIADNHTSDGSGNGIFISEITGLIPNTTYFVRAYATNGIGIAYGNEISFTTLTVGFNCGDMVYYEGQNYNTVQIGNQCWFKENLNVGIKISGYGSQNNNNQIEKYCFYNNEDYCITYGGLYQWDEMMQYETQQGVQGICPDNWHIPTQSEWTELSNYLGGDAIAGGKLKEVGTVYWHSPNTGATNESGFTSLGAGYLWFNNTFTGLTYFTVYWSSTEQNYYFTYTRNLQYYDTNFLEDTEQKGVGFSVRCLKN
jgi:uncharacterized protein (TIGR02145 family)